jgi:putative PIN family toxin of toxin-antitoxin system
VTAPDTPPPVVVDTNVVLDLLVFPDAAAAPLRAALADGTLRWLVTVPMREELARVLRYPQLAPRLVYYGLAPDDVMAAFDARVTVVGVAAKAPVTCKDPDDQKFIDLAVAHRAMLFSKDHAVLRLKKRLLALGVAAGPSLAALPALTPPG